MIRRLPSARKIRSRFEDCELISSSRRPYIPVFYLATLVPHFYFWSTTRINVLFVGSDRIRYSDGIRSISVTRFPIKILQESVGSDSRIGRPWYDEIRNKDSSKTGYEKKYFYLLFCCPTTSIISSVNMLKREEREIYTHKFKKTSMQQQWQRCFSYLSMQQWLKSLGFGIHPYVRICIYNTYTYMYIIYNINSDFKESRISKIPRIPRIPHTCHTWNLNSILQLRVGSNEYSFCWG